jgi:hypothetical protein
MSDPQCFAIIPFDGPPPPEAIVIGDLDAVLRYLPQTVAAEELEQRALGLADRLTVRERALSDGVWVLTQSVGKFMDACGRLVDGEEERKADKARRDAEAAAREREAEVAAYLDAEPEPGGHPPEPSLESEASGEPEPEPTPYDAQLSPLGAPERERYRAGADAEGDLPPELTKKVPAELGTFIEPDPEKLGGPPDPHQIPQPTAISLNSLDEARP